MAYTLLRLRIYTTKITVICTFKNEESSIKIMLDSLLTGHKYPDEIILVDGGSTDKTDEIIYSYTNKGHPIKLIYKDGINIAEGRNIAIDAAKYDIIASIDAGCKAHSDWLQSFHEIFDKDKTVDVVAGFYLPDPKSEYEDVIGNLLYPRLDIIDPNKFLPSSRSVAFKKRCWQEIDGYPEYLYTGEDTLFDIKLKSAGCKFAFSENAIVYWRPRSNLFKLFKQYYLYAKGATQAGVLNTIAFEAFGQNVFSYLIPIILDYGLYLFRKQKIKQLMYIPLILFVILFAKLLGIIIGKLSIK